MEVNRKKKQKQMRAVFRDRPLSTRPPPRVRRRRHVRTPRAIKDDAVKAGSGGDSEQASVSAATPPTTPPPPAWRPYPAFRLATQALAVTLPAGIGGVDLVGRALWSTPAPALTPDQLGAAAAVTETLTLAAVVGLFRAAAARPEGGVCLPAYDLTSPETVLLGLAGAVGGALSASACSAAWEVAHGATAASALEVSSATATVGRLLSSASAPGAAALVAASAAGAPAVEELVYRGLMLPALIDGGLAAPAAVALSAAAFAASHTAVAPTADLPALFGLGLALGATALAAGRLRGTEPVDLAAPTLAHALYNVGLLAAAVAVAGGT
jgi:membrane protease YdiL (CAAX protease family)